MRSILWIDDEPIVNDMGVLFLKKLGYQARALYSGIEALSVFRSRPHAFDLVITDYMMPEMTGDELTQRIREIRPDIPVVLCTGSGNLPADTLANWGIYAQLPKPYSIGDVSRLVRNLVEESGQNHKGKPAPGMTLPEGCHDPARICGI
ncbi:response regulator [Desulfobacter sp.]|uniref:response regulator n=1 Tax=Desulfobacter sp. TaxID=2294 RepID=UPI003D0FFF62